MSTIQNEEQLSAFLVKKIKEEFEKTPYYIKLVREKEKKVKEANLASTHEKKRLKLLTRVSEIDNTINLLWKMAKKEYFNSLPPSTQSALSTMGAMTEDDKNDFRRKVNAMAFVTDILETLVVSCNDTLKKYEDNSRIVMFDGIISSMNQIRELMRTIHGRESVEMAEVFADYADEVTDMVIGKMDEFLDAYGKAEKESNDGQKQPA